MWQIIEETVARYDTRKSIIVKQSNRLTNIAKELVRDTSQHQAIPSHSKLTEWTLNFTIAF